MVKRGADAVAGEEFAVEEVEAEGVENLVLDDALEGAGTVSGVVAFAGEEIPGGFVEIEEDILFFEAGQKAAQLDIDNARYLPVVEPVKNDGFVDAVEKFRAEMAPECFRDTSVALGFVQILHDVLAADIRGQDDDGIFEIDGAALAIGDAAIVEHLKEDIENIVVGLLDFIEKND